MIRAQKDFKEPLGKGLVTLYPPRFRAVSLVKPVACNIKFIRTLVETVKAMNCNCAINAIQSIQTSTVQQ